MRIVNKILKITFNVLTVIIGVILLISLYSWMQVKFFHKDYASVLGHSVFDVVTGSMSGTIEINDYVVVKNTKNVELNDIITFREGDTLVTHRVVQIVGDKIITRGDANNSDDIAITKDVIVGKVVFVIPKAGIWKTVLMDTKVLIAILVTLILFTIFFSVEERKYVEVKHVANLDALKKKPKKEKKVVKANLDVLKK